MNFFPGWHTLLLQSSEQSFLFASDKVYTVLTVLLTIFLLVALYLILTNKKINELEQKISEIENKEL